MLYFYSLKFFNWRIIALQHCVSFCCTTMWINYTYMYTYACMHVKSLQLCLILWDETSLSVGFSRQDYCSGLCIHIRIHWASSMVQWVKNLPAMWETQKTEAQSLGWDNPLEEEMASLHANKLHSSILVWKIPWTEESMGSQRVSHNSRWPQFFLSIHISPPSWVSLPPPQPIPIGRFIFKS